MPNAAILDAISALDPVTFFRRVHGFEPYSWQRGFLVANDRRVLTLKGRQCGFSTALGTFSVYLAWTRPNALILFTSKVQRGSNELLRSASLAARALGVAPLEEASTVRLLFENDSRILSVPGSTPDNFRGYSKPDLFGIDEAGFIEESVLAAVLPMFATSSRGRLIVGGTPNGRGNWLHREWEEGRDWRRFRVPSDTIPTIPKAFLERERESLGPDWYGQEYECAFKVREGQVFAEEVLQRMFRSSLGEGDPLRDPDWTVTLAPPIEAKRLPSPAEIDWTVLPTYGQPGGLERIEAPPIEAPSAPPAFLLPIDRG